MASPNFAPISCGDDLAGNTTEEGGTSYSGRSNTNDALFELTPPRDDTYTFSTCNEITKFHTFLHVYNDIRMPKARFLVERKAEEYDDCDVEGNKFGVAVSVNLTAGTTYYIVVDGDSKGGSNRGPEHGAYELNVDCLLGTSRGAVCKLCV